MSEYAITCPGGIRSTRSRTSSAYGVGRLSATTRGTLGLGAGTGRGRSALWDDHRVVDDGDVRVGIHRAPVVPIPPAHVVEPEQPRRIRRPNDALRLVGWSTATVLLLVLGDVALGTTSGLEEDLGVGDHDAAGPDPHDPGLRQQPAAAAAAPADPRRPGLAASLAHHRRRGRSRRRRMAARLRVLGAGPGHAVPDAARRTDDGERARRSRTPIAFPMLAAVVALASVDGLRGRPRLAAAVWGSALGFIVLLLFDRSATPLGPRGQRLRWSSRRARLPLRAGHRQPSPLRRRRRPGAGQCRGAPGVPRSGWARATTSGSTPAAPSTGASLDIRVIDRDRRSAGLIYQLYRRVRVQGVVERPPTWSVRRAVDQAALPVLAARRQGVRTPDLIAAASVTSDAAVLAFEHVPGLHTFDAMDPSELDDATIADLWEQVRRLHRAGIAHEELHAGNLALDADGRVWLLGLENGEIAADQLTLRIDDGELLVTTALIVGADRAVRGALQELTAQRLGEALPLLQTIALSRTNRRAVKQNRRCAAGAARRGRGGVPVGAHRTGAAGAHATAARSSPSSPSRSRSRSCSGSSPR